MDIVQRSLPPGKADTPCIGVCRVDSSGRFCTGCLRTLDEVANWSRYSDAERARILQALRARRGLAPLAASDPG